MRERDVEKKLIDEVKKRGGLCEKWTSGTVGWPDRIIILPDGKIAFAELKAPGKKLRPLQERRKRQLESLGFSVFCIDNPESIGGVLDEICTA